MRTGRCIAVQGEITDEEDGKTSEMRDDGSSSSLLSTGARGLGVYIYTSEGERRSVRGRSRWNNPIS